MGTVVQLVIQRAPLISRGWSQAAAAGAHPYSLFITPPLPPFPPSSWLLSVFGAAPVDPAAPAAPAAPAPAAATVETVSVWVRWSCPDLIGCRFVWSPSLGAGRGVAVLCTCTSSQCSQ